MDFFPTGARTVLARAVSAEIRARIGADRSLTGQLLAQKIERSQNYVAERLRDEKPFSIDDIEGFSKYFGESPSDFVKACMKHWDRVEAERAAAWEEAGEAPGPRVDMVWVGPDGVVSVVEAKQAPAPNVEEAFLQIQHYMGGPWELVAPDGSELGHHRTRQAALDAARIVLLSNDTISDLNVRRATRARKSNLPVTEAARPKKRKPKMGEE